MKKASKTKKELVQQGDVLIFSEAELPANVKRVDPKSRGYVLAEGETTGHAHVIPTLATCEMYTDEINQLWIKAKSALTVTHEEHGAVKVAPGVHRIGIVRTVDPYKDEVQKVRD